MLDRLQARLHRERTPPAYDSTFSVQASDQRHPDRSETEDVANALSQQDLGFESSLTRALSNGSISTTSTILPSYNTVSTTTNPPPKYTPNRSSTPTSHNRHSIPASHPLNSAPYTSPPTQYPGDALWSLGFTLSWPLTKNRHKYETRPGKKGAKRSLREIPLDHPVHDMSADEQWGLRRRGMDPVAVAEMKMGQRRGARRNRQSV